MTMNSLRKTIMELDDEEKLLSSYVDDESGIEQTFGGSKG